MNVNYLLYLELYYPDLKGYGNLRHHAQFM